jgi:hypothetical protein
MWKVVAATLGVVGLVAAIAAGAYIFWIDSDDDDTASAGAGGVPGITVNQVLISNEIDANGLPINPRLVFPAGSRAIRATVRLTGVKVGQTIEGTWFQLGTAQSGAEGVEVSSSETKLTAEQISEQGQTRVAFSVGTSSASLPSDAWLLRIYVDGVLVKTSGFVIGGTGTAGSAPPSAVPSGTPRP